MNKRPAGVSIIAFIYILISGVGLYSSLSMGMSNWFTFATMVLFGLAGIGFYMGQKWAWWVISTFVLISITSNSLKLIVALNQVGLESAIQKTYLLMAAKVVVQSLILILMFSKPVIDFVKLENFTKPKLFLYLLAATVGMFLLLYIF